MTPQRSTIAPEAAASESQASLGQSDAPQSSQGISQPRVRISSRSLMEENRALKADLAKRDKTVTKLSTQMSIKEAKVNLLNSKLTLEAYAKLAGRTLPDQSAEAHQDHAVFGLCGEAGEIADVFKKARFQGHDLDLEHVKEEAGDLLWHLAQLAHACGFTLEDVAWGNVQKLEARYKGEFSAEASRNRAESAGREVTDG